MKRPQSDRGLVFAQECAYAGVSTVVWQWVCGIVIIILALLAAALLVSVARADSGMLLGGVANRQMPLDPLTTPTACYSERRLRTAYVTNKGINIVRASDSTTTDVGFTSAGYPNKATETAFCNATTCKLVTMYDQCGSNNLTQATDANRYTRQAGPGGFNASQATTTQTHVGGSNITPATGLATFSVVANRSSGTGNCQWLRENGANNSIAGTSGSANWRLLSGASGFNRGAAEATWHSAIGVMNGASSVLNIDGGETTGTATGVTTAGAPAISGATATCNQTEAIVWDNYAMTAGERAYLNSNNRVSWGF